MARRETSVEWVGGIVTMPAYVTGEGDPYRPESLFWVSAEGAVLGHSTGKPGEVLETASTSLREAMERPMWGQPHVPARVRVSSRELQRVLREGHPGLDVVCAPTPEIDAVLAVMREKMGEDADEEQSYLSFDVGPDAVAGFFRAAAGLYRAKPWEVVPGDQCLISVTIEELGVEGRVLSVIGQLGQSFGLAIFSGLGDFEAYLDAAEAIELGREPSLPPHLSLNFERGAELSAALRREVAENRWEVMAADAYPWLVAVDEDLIARPPTANELTLVEAISLSLPEFLKAGNALAAAWNDGEPVARTLSVQTHAGDLEVTLRAPYGTAPDWRPPFDVLAELHDLVQPGEEMDHDARRVLEDELIEKFAASPEAKELAEIGFCHFVLDLAAEYFGATVATLDARDLRELVFELIPRKVSIEASAARAIIEESRALYRFLQREFALGQADACLRVLGGDAVAKLEAALSDSSQFGMAKSMFMSGREAGFDMSSRAGVGAWLQGMQRGSLPSSVRPPPSGAPRGASKAVARAKKAERKAARKARKRNR